MFRLLARSITRRPLLSSCYLNIRSTATWEPTKQQGDGDGPNHRLITFLTDEMYKMAIEYPFKSIASELHNAIKTIHGLDYQVTVKHIPLIPSIPEVVVPRIVTFLGSGSKSDFRASRIGRISGVAELPTDVVQKKIKTRILNSLQQVNGIGPIKARILLNSGCTTIGQLRDEPYLSMLPKPTQAIILFGKDADTQLSRTEAEAFQNALQKVLSQEFELLLLGSYRREATPVTDLEFVLFHPSYMKPPTCVSRTTAAGKELPPEVRVQAPQSLLSETVASLRKEGLVLASLSGGPSRWRGLVKIVHEQKELVRKININLIPQESKAAAILAFTGDLEYFTMCQRKANSQDLFLNEYGLWRRPPNLSPLVSTPSHPDSPSDVRTSQPEFVEEYEWELVNTPEEADILNELQLDSHAPLYKRNLCNVSKIGPKELPPFSYGSEPIKWYIREQPLWHVSQFLPIPRRAKHMPRRPEHRSSPNEKKKIVWRGPKDFTQKSTERNSINSRGKRKHFDSRQKSHGNPDRKKSGTPWPTSFNQTKPTNR